MSLIPCNKKIPLTNCYRLYPKQLHGNINDSLPKDNHAVIDFFQVHHASEPFRPPISVL